MHALGLDALVQLRELLGRDTSAVSQKIAVDSSSASERAMRLGPQIAPHADIVLLHAFDVPFEGKLRFAGGKRR